MVPKFYAIDRAEAVARRVARPLRTFSVVFRPLIVVLTAVSNRILRLLGVDMKRKQAGGSPDELKLLIAESHAGGHIDPGEAGMLTGVFHLHEQEARQVMTPIPAVVTIDSSQDVESALQRVRLQWPHASGRDRGRRPRQRPRTRPRLRAGQQADAGRAQLADRAARPRRADRPRDEAAGRPAGRPPAPADLDGGRRRRVRASRRAS